VSLQNFTLGIKSFKFKIESKVSFSPASPTTQKENLYFIAFLISSLVEAGFIWGTYLLPKVHNHLDVVRRVDLLLSLTALKPDIQKLASVLSGTRNTLNVMSVVNRILLLA
jgi:hypothetical protein